MSTKKIAVIIVIVLIALSPFIISSFTDDTEVEETQNTLKSTIFDDYESLRVKYNNARTETDMRLELEKYIESKDLKVHDLGDNMLMVKFPATEGYETAKSTTCHIYYDLANKKESAQVGAITLATLVNSEEHGKINLLVTPSNDKSKSVVSKLDSKYLNTDNLLDLCHRDKTSLFFGSAMTKTYTLTKPLNHNAPNGTIAYKIEVKNLRKDDSGDRSSKHINPIVYIGDILASAKASGSVLEIADFTSKGSITQYPHGAKAIVVIDQSNEKKFLSKLESAESTFNDKIRKTDSDAEFIFEEVEVPKRTLSLDDTSRVLSLLYTLVDGVYATTEEDNEGENLALSTISSIDLSSYARLHVMARSIDDEVSKDMDHAMKTIANLSDFDVTQSKRYPMWEAYNDGDLEDPKPSEYVLYTKDVLKKHDMKPKVRYSFVELDVVYMLEKNPNLNAVSLGINIENAYDYAKTLTTFFKNMKVEEDEAKKEAEEQNIEEEHDVQPANPIEEE